MREGTYARCAIDVFMPAGPADRSWGPAYQRETRTTLATPAEWEAAIAACAGTYWITVVSEPRAREQAVRDTIEFFDRAPRAVHAQASGALDTESIQRKGEELFRQLNFK